MRVEFKHTFAIALLSVTMEAFAQSSQESSALSSKGLDRVLTTVLPLRSTMNDLRGASLFAPSYSESRLGNYTVLEIDSLKKPEAKTEAEIAAYVLRTYKLPPELQGPVTAILLRYERQATELLTEVYERKLPPETRVQLAIAADAIRLEQLRFEATVRDNIMFRGELVSMSKSKGSPTPDKSSDAPPPQAFRGSENPKYEWLFRTLKESKNFLDALTEE